MRLSTLDKYVLREIAGPFLVGLGLFLAIVAFGQVLKISDTATGMGVTGLEVLRALGYSLPPLMGLLIPVSALFATLLGVGRVASDREVIALCSAGMSPFRLLRVPAVLGVALAALCAVALIEGEPWGMRGLRRLLGDSAQRTLAQGVRVGEFNNWLPGVTFLAQRKEGDQLHEVLFADHRDAQRPIMMVARSGSIRGGERAGDIFFQLKDGEIIAKDDKSGDFRVIGFDSSRYRLDVRSLVQGSTRSLSSLQEQSIAELRQSIAEAPNTKQRARLTVTLQRKLALPAATLLFSLLAVPLACRANPGARARGFLYSSGIVGAYYYVGRTFELSARTGSIDPTLAVWLPNLVGIGVLLVLLWRLRWSST